MQSTVVCKSLYCIDIKRPFRTGSVVFVTHKEFLRNHLMLEVKTLFVLTVKSTLVRVTQDSLLLFCFDFLGLHD